MVGTTKNRKKEINAVNIGRMGSSVAEVLQVFEQLVADRNIEGIQKFYQEVCTDTVDMNDDRDPFFHNFLMQFSNMKPCNEAKEGRKEPITGNHLPTNFLNIFYKLFPISDPSSAFCPDGSFIFLV